MYCVWFEFDIFVRSLTISSVVVLWMCCMCSLFVLHLFSLHHTSPHTHIHIIAGCLVHSRLRSHASFPVSHPHSAQHQPQHSAVEYGLSGVVGHESGVREHSAGVFEWCVCGGQQRPDRCSARGPHYCVWYVVRLCA